MRRAIAIQPDRARAHCDLGVGLQAMSRFDEAIAAYRSAIALQPKYVDAHAYLASVLKQCGKLDDAIVAYREVIACNPTEAAAHNNLGIALWEKGDLDEAISIFRQAVALKPDFSEAFTNLGICLRDKGQVRESIAAYQQAIALRPDSAEAHYNLGISLQTTGDLDEAVSAYRQAITVNPHHHYFHCNLGNTLKDRGDLDDAIAAYGRALALMPTSALAHSNLVYLLHFHPDYDAKKIYEEATRWSQQHAAPLARSIRLCENDRDPERPLRIGYVSGNFCTHPLADNFLPLALSQDTSHFPFICYSWVKRPDAMTDRLRSLAPEWRDIANLSEAQAADLIRQDKIDILVDLGLHMANNRLLIFAFKPAPIQVTALCSMGTTGLRTIDYRISDRYCDPPGFNDAFYSEQTIRLPDCYFCHEAPIDTPSVSDLPVKRVGHITFGSLNNFCKVTPAVLKIWRELLAAIPDSRLMLRCPSGFSAGEGAQHHERARGHGRSA